jgi:hypothetical protein
VRPWARFHQLPKTPRARALSGHTDKAALPQKAKPDQPVVPVLTSRVAHTTTFWMASQLGFITLDMDRQFIAASVDVGDDALLEVGNELHFIDLHEFNGPAVATCTTVRTRPRR